MVNYLLRKNMSDALHRTMADSFCVDKDTSLPAAEVLPGLESLPGRNDPGETKTCTIGITLASITRTGFFRVCF
jgi:hypothetical protein